MTPVAHEKGNLRDGEKGGGKVVTEEKRRGEERKGERKEKGKEKRKKKRKKKEEKEQGWQLLWNFLYLTDYSRRQLCIQIKSYKIQIAFYS